MRPPAMMVPAWAGLFGAVAALSILGCSTSRPPERPEPLVVGTAREPHLRLQDDSRVDGSTGCNSFCTDPALSRQEQRFLQVLASVDRAAAVGDQLTLYAQDRPVARLVAVYFQ